MHHREHSAFTSTGGICVPLLRSVCDTAQQSNSSLAPRFYGITTLQAFMYYRDKYNDPPILKLSVSLTTTSESLNPLTTGAR